MTDLSKILILNKSKQAALEAEMKKERKLEKSVNKKDLEEQMREHK